MQSEFAMRQSIDLLRANTTVATSPDSRGDCDLNGDAGKKDKRRHQNNPADADASDHQAQQASERRDPHHFR
jgi:hypothetical protein